MEDYDTDFEYINRWQYRVNIENKIGFIRGDEKTALKLRLSLDI